MVKRVKTGVGGLDEALQGGLPEENLVLVSGGAGTGKSTLCLQYLLTGALIGEKGLYVSTEQKEFELQKQALAYGWGLKKYIDDGLIRIIYLDILREESFLDKIRTNVNEFSPKRLVLDSLSTISEFAAVTDFAKETLLKRGGVAVRGVDKVTPKQISEKTTIKRSLASLIDQVRSFHLTALLTSELPERGKSLSSDGISEFLADGVILLHFFGVGEAEFRSMVIRKMRYTDHDRKSLSYKLMERGIEIISEDEILLKTN